MVVHYTCCYAHCFLFLLLQTIPLYGGHSLSSFLLKGTLGCFSSFAIINSAAANNHDHMCCPTYASMSISGMAGARECAFLIFIGNIQLLSINVVSVYIPTSNVCKCSFPHCHQQCYHFFIIASLTSGKMGYWYSSNLYFSHYNKWALLFWRGGNFPLSF